MIRLVYRQLLLDGPRTVLMSIVVGAVIAVLLVLEGFEQGLYEQLRQAVRDRGGGLIATQAGVSTLIASRSVLPQLARQAVEAVPGVRIAHPLTSLPVIYDQDGRRTPIYLNVFDTAGGPARIISGRAIQDNRGIVVDESLARRYGLMPGSEFVISDYRFRVDGIARGYSAMFTPFAFITYDGLIDFYFNADLAKDISTFPLVAFLRIDLEAGADPGAVAASIKRHVPEVDVFTPGQLAQNDEGIGRNLFHPVLRLLIGVGYAAGLVAVGLFSFASVNARTREFGVLKALGFRTPYLCGVVIAEAAAISALAVPVGVVSGQALATLIVWQVPLYLVLPLQLEVLLRTVLAALAFGVLGALIPIRTIVRIEPDMVFRT